jgi:putative transposase
MPDYRRNRVPGRTFFFTVNLPDRRSDLLVSHIDALRDAVRGGRTRAPFRVDAWVVTRPRALPVELAGRRRRLPRRWRAIKIAFASRCQPSNRDRRL